MISFSLFVFLFRDHFILSLILFLSTFCLFYDINIFYVFVGEKIDFSEYTVHDVAGVTKMYFRELPEPLFTFDLYVCFYFYFRLVN